MSIYAHPKTGLIKICGLSTPQTLEVALEAGADMIGLVHFPKSPRHVSVEQGRALAAMARGKAKIVALTVNADDHLLNTLMKTWAPDVIQLHGEESPADLMGLRTRYSGQLMKAIGISSHGDLALLNIYAPVCDLLLLDAKPPEGANLPGGNGVTFDWSVLENLICAVPVLLSGGLTPENIPHAILSTPVEGVDVSSGVESGAGVKDPHKIRDFMTRAREAFAKRGISG
jgi:phosphoribosylanthranilate isomerase